MFKLPSNESEYPSYLRKIGEHQIAEYLYFLELERDATVRYLQEWSCISCSRRGKREFCDVCNRNRVLIARGCALSKDMYKYRKPHEI